MTMQKQMAKIAARATVATSNSSTCEVLFLGHLTTIALPPVFTGCTFGKPLVLLISKKKAPANYKTFCMLESYVVGSQQLCKIHFLGVMDVVWGRANGLGHSIVGGAQGQGQGVGGVGTPGHDQAGSTYRKKLGASVVR